MSKKLAVLFLFTLIAFNSAAQSKRKIDSLTKILAHPSPARQIEALNNLALIYGITDSAKTFSYANKAKELSAKTKNIQGLATAYRAMGIAQSFKYRVKEALVYFDLAKENFQKINKINDVGVIYADIGRLYKLHKDSENALTFFLKAEVIHRAANNEKNLIADYNNLGSAYSDLGQKSKAIKAYLLGLKLAEKLNLETENQQLISNLGNLMQGEKNYDEANRYYRKAIAIFKKQNDQVNVGISTLNMANSYAAISDYKASTALLMEAIAAFTSTNFTRGIQICYNNLGALQMRQSKYREAIPILQKSLEIIKTSPNKAGQALVEQNIGFAYTKMNELGVAETWFERAEQSAKKYKSDISVFAEIYTHRATLDSAKGDYYNALIRKSMYTKIKDSLLNEKLNRQVIELQTQYETQKKQGQIDLLTTQNTIQSLNLTNKALALNSSTLQNERDQLTLRNKDLDLGKKNIIIAQRELKAKNDKQQINILHKQTTIQQLQIEKRNQTIGVIIGVALLFGLAGYQFFKRRKLQQQAEMTAQLALQTEQAAKEVIEAEESERKRIAGDLHDGVGQLLSVVSMNLSVLGKKLKFEDQESDETYHQTLALLKESYKEMRSISHQMMPNALEKNGLPEATRLFLQEINPTIITTNFYSAGFLNRLNSNVEIMLYRVIQECVNNVIKHAQAIHLDVQLEFLGNSISCSIEDDGKGFDLAADADGIGLNNIRSRVNFLKGQLEISSSAGRGTLVVINVPI